MDTRRPVRATVVASVLAAILVSSARTAAAQGAEEGGAACPRGDSTQTGLKTSIELNAALTSATVDAQAYGADLVMVNHRHPEACGWRRQRTQIRATPSYDSKKKENAAPIITRSYIASFQHLLYVPGNRFFVSGNARYLHNNSLGVYLQQAYTLVLGREVDVPFASMEFDIGPAFVGQNFMQSEPSTGFVALSVSELIDIPLDFIATGVALTENVRVTLPFGREDPWLVTAFGALVLPVSPRLKVNVTVSDDYLSNVPSGFENNFLTTKVGVVITLGRL